MPYRTTALTNGEIYHIFNRGVNKQSIFWDERDYNRVIDSMIYYSFIKPQIRYSYLNRLLPDERAQVWKELRAKHDRLVDLIAYVYMPNHYHFLLKQLTDDGITHFLGTWQNSFCRYVNTRHSRIGPLFQGQFKAVRISTDAQLVHVSRYIHLNPHTSLIVNDKKELEEYPWSSFSEYINPKAPSICQKDIVLGQFKDSDSYKSLVFDQADYQRSLKRIKDLLID